MALCVMHRAGNCYVTDHQRCAVAGHAATWERLAGLVGRVRTFGIAAMPVLAGLALFAGWSWWYAGGAVIASGMGKWLARGFEHHRQRMIFEAETMVRGMASPEFWTEWVEAYTGRN